MTPQQSIRGIAETSEHHLFSHRLPDSIILPRFIQRSKYLSLDLFIMLFETPSKFAFITGFLVPPTIKLNSSFVKESARIESTQQIPNIKIQQLYVTSSDKLKLKASFLHFYYLEEYFPAY